MGKGRRNREQRQDLHPFEALYQKAEKHQKTAGGLAVAALVVMVLGMILPLWSMAIMSRNIHTFQYADEEVMALTPVMPIGRLAFAMIAFGVLVGAVLVWYRRPYLATIGMSVCMVGECLLVWFAIVIGQVFAYDPIEQRGLAFADLLVRYYILLVPFVLLAAAMVCCVLAHKKRAVAAIMEEATDTAPTVMLDDEETV